MHRLVVRRNAGGEVRDLWGSLPMAKPTRRRADQVVAMPTPGSDSRTPNQAFVEVTDRDIACHAFELYGERGCQHGRDVDDWLKAERELRNAVRS
ncbi:MAG: hypothetical protein DMF90_19630 [Acidobacteria bacterium]|nr:MAG: hypothetical protein DMF90_19630 [Acidobacteriota bacterium]